jgi:hypothetical protein
MAKRLLPNTHESRSQPVARLNSTVLSLIDRLGVRNVARQARYFDVAVEQAIQLILSGRCSAF